MKNVQASLSTHTGEPSLGLAALTFLGMRKRRFKIVSVFEIRVGPISHVECCFVSLCKVPIRIPSNHKKKTL